MKYAVWWVVAAVVATSIGVLGVVWTIDSVQVRGTIGDYEAIRTADLNETSPSAAPAGPDVTDQLTGEWGTFVVGCNGVYAYGVDTRPAPGWEVLSFESGPDDDVDVVFVNDDRSIDIEVFCNRGRPTIAELERHTRPAAS